MDVAVDARKSLDDQRSALLKGASRLRANDEQKQEALQATPLRKCLETIIDYRGKTPKKLGSDWTDTGYRALSAINVKDSGLTSTDTIRCVDAETYKKWMKEEVRQGDILLTSEAPAGEVMIWDSDEKIVLSQRLFCLRANKRFDNRFLKYYLQSPTGKREVNRTRSGSTVAGISAEMFDQIQVLHPKTGTQQKIAAVLSAIDAKIDLNNRINAELEALARTVYDYWFVQFDFPDARGRPYRSSGGKMVWNDTLKREIPAGWGVDLLGNIAENLDSKRVPLSKKEREERSGSVPYYGATGLMGYVDVPLFDEELLLLAEDGSVMDDRGRVILQRIWGKAWVNNHAHVLRPSSGWTVDLLYHALRDVPAIRMMSGSIQKKITQDNLNATRVVAPPTAIKQSLAQLLLPLRERQKQTVEESAELTRLRDWLLPLLMNGQVRVA